MIESAKYFPKLRAVAEAGLVAVGAGFVGVAGITLRDHRELTHRSVILHRALRRFFDWEQRTLSVGEPTIWAAVHRIHHNIPDATLAPYYHIARGLQWVEEHPEKAQGVTVPDTFSHLDPYITKVSREDVTTVGNLAIGIMKDRLGDEYKPPVDYSTEALNSLFHPERPRYQYPSYKRHVGEYSQDDIADILLGDPHSPARIPPPEENGVHGVAEKNVLLYTRHADLFRARPDLKPKDLQNEQGTNRKATRFDIATGFALPSALVLFRRGKYTAKDVVIAAAVGSTINAIRIGMEVLGGNVTNSLGHAGEMTHKRMIQAVKDGKYIPLPNPDGTLSTNTAGAGKLGQALSRLTLDEVGGQEEHHSHPEKIAYTSKKGLEALFEAPWGSLISFLAHNKRFPFINPGPGFDLREGETRPDQPHQAMDIIHQLRAKQLAKENATKVA